MVQPGLGGALDTPRTNLGDATYLNQPDFGDISPEATFVSPAKDGNFIQQMRNGRTNGGNFRTPRQQRGPLADRRNLPQSVGGVEFTPLLKSAARNSVRRLGKENGAAGSNTPALNKINEDDMTPLPRMDTSIYTGSRNQSYMENTLPQVDSSSVASTPLALSARRGGDRGPLQEGNGLSLREQENVINRIEKENFGLKLKIHFLEEALRKAGPGFSEAALKENTELKVDKVTMQRELSQNKKHLATAEGRLEEYHRQVTELHEKAKREHTGESQRAEVDQIRQTLKDREGKVEELQRQLNEGQDDIADLEADLREKDRFLSEKEDELKELQRQLNDGQRDQDDVEKLQDDIADLEAELREKDRLLSDKDDELEDLRDKFNEAEDKAEDFQRRMVEMEQEEQQSEELEKAKETIESLQQDIRRLEAQLEDMKEQTDDAVTQKKRAEGDLQELQEEMADKSVVTKGLSRQVEEKVAHLQDELDKSGREYAALEREFAEANEENDNLRSTVKELEAEREDFQELENDLQVRTDEKDMLQSRYDTLVSRSESLELQVTKLQSEVEDLEDNLSKERQHALDIEKHIEKDLRSQYRNEIERLNGEISDLQAEVRERDNLYDNDSEKWAAEKQTLESERDRAEGRAAGLQRTIDALREAEGSLSDKESKLKDAMASEAERHKSDEAALNRQINSLRDALETRQSTFTSLRNELSTVRDELRQTQVDYQTQVAKVAALEDEVNVLQTRTPAHEKAGSGRQDLAERHKSDEAALNRQIDSLQDILETRQSMLTSLRNELSAVRDELRQTQVDYQTQVNKVATLEGEVDVLQAQIHAHENAGSGRQDPSPAKEEAEVRDLRQQLATARQSISDLKLKNRQAELEAAETMHDLRKQLDLEDSDLRQQLATARQSISDLKSKNRQAELEPAEAMQDLRKQLDDFEEENILLEESLEEARQRAEEMAAEHERNLLQMKRKLEKAERERKMDRGSHRTDQYLRESRAEIDNLEHDVRHQQETIDALVASEGSLRRKLEKARSERAAYRFSAEKLRRDIQRAHRLGAAPVEDHMAVTRSRGAATDEALDTVVRAAEGAQERHKKELRGMAMKAEWMQARWEREASLRSDAAYAKRFLQLQLDVANACNKAQLRELEHIRTNLLGNRKPLGLPSATAREEAGKPRPSLKSFLVMARFIARMRLSARDWAKQEKVRLRLVAATEEQRKTKTRRQLKVVRADEAA